MNTFVIALIAVAVLLCSALPGYIMMKKKMLSESCIPGISKILLYVGQPCLSIYTFASLEFSLQKLIDIGIFALICILIHVIMLLGAFLVLRKRYDNPIYRIMTIAFAFANCAFFGIPIIEALLPDIAAEIIVYTTVYAVIMNTVGWTLGIAIISNDKSKMSLKKIILNPAMIGMLIALPIFIFSIPLEESFLNMITIMGRMVSPLSMIVMGMRLATSDIKSVFTNSKIYIAVAVKQLLMPLIAFGLVLLLPLDTEIKKTFFILAACPVASVVLNYSEIVGASQREAANSVLLGTMLSVVTLPVMMLLLPLLG